MAEEHNMRRVTAIKNGTVIDHIPSGQALKVLELLSLSTDTSVPVSLVMNVPSKKMGAKDIIKVEEVFFEITNTDQAFNKNFCEFDK